jgi:hypothetical protein
MPINHLKISSAIFLIFANISPVFSQQTLSISGKYENGETVNNGNIFLLDDYCRFFIRDEDENKPDLTSCVWRFECLDNDSTYIIDREISDNSEFDFLLDKLYVSPASLKRIKAGNDVLFQAKISCTGQTSSGENFDLSFPVFLNLLPAVPIINSTVTVVNPEEKKIYINLKLLFDRSDIYELVVREFEWPYTFTNIHPDRLEFNYIYYDYIDSVVFRAIGANKFGLSDTVIKITYMGLLTGLNEIHNGAELSFYPNPFSDVLHIKEEYRDIEKLIITDAGGRTVKIINKVETPTIPVADLPRGMYIITVSQKQNSENKSFKLIKK